ncbi:16S rRNA (cytidine(1402)-2'-O)-methyltransferase [Patescibacteria group bacterium]|nr:16S rRNA (cytidine(1402)-2'-O)-methyltransferase [Patescibacteria group bacterium]
MSSAGGTLFMVATPIGNLEDITLRALRILREADAIYAEDTRVTAKLLARYDIKKPLFSYREAASRNTVDKMIADITNLLQKSEQVAYVSDAGTPGLSDPGQYLVEKTVAAGFPVVPIPGPSGLATLMSVSGLSVGRVLFVGFLPKKKGHQTALAKLRAVLLDETADGLIFYESPERIIKLLQELVEWKLPLQVCLGRELTKMYEEITRGSLESVLAELRKKPRVKGEITVMITK